MRAARSGALRWEEIQERLNRVAAATEAATSLSAGQGRALMETRARRLASAPAPAPSVAEVFEVVVFALGGERYGIETRHVREITRLGHVAQVPETADFVLGLVNLRGDLLTVLDLRRLFGVTAPEVGPRSCIVVLGSERPEIGVLADAVHEVTTLRTSEVLEATLQLIGVGREYLRGVMRDAMVLVDGALLLEARLFGDEAEESGSEPGTRGVS